MASVAQRGTTHGDSLTPEGFASNNAGGTLGGISTGQDLEVSIAIKPTSSILSPRDTVDLAGQPTANAPRWTAALGADYSRAVMRDLTTGMSVRVRYSSAYSVSPFGQPLAVQPSYVNCDASLRLASVDDRWQLALIGKNLTNKFVATSAFDQSGTGTASGGVTGSPANQFGLFMPPRTVALELTGRF